MPCQTNTRDEKQLVQVMGLIVHCQTMRVTPYEGLHVPRVMRLRGDVRQSTQTHTPGQSAHTPNLGSHYQNFSASKHTSDRAFCRSHRPFQGQFYDPSGSLIKLLHCKHKKKKLRMRLNFFSTVGNHWRRRRRHLRIPTLLRAEASLRMHCCKIRDKVDSRTIDICSSRHRLTRCHVVGFEKWLSIDLYIINLAHVYIYIHTLSLLFPGMR